MICVLCGGGLSAGRESRCEVCGKVYPTLGGVFVADANVNARLEVVAEILRTTRQTLSAFDPSSTFRSDAARATEAQLENLALLDECARPALEALGSPPQRGFRLADMVARYALGWPIDRLLPYFYVDWSDAEPFVTLRDEVIATVKHEAECREHAVVLGAGACGLVAALAGRFERVSGVELSLLSLLVARRLVDGSEITLRLREANDSRVTLVCRERCEAPVALVAGDATDLPYADASVDLVTTQYLLDIVPDPHAIGLEVNRVLRPGGLWISFGPPFTVRGDPELLGPRQIADVRPFFDELGFATRRAEERMYRLMDFSALGGSSGSTQRVQLVVARKERTLPPDPVRDAFQRWARGETEPLLELRAGIPPGLGLYALEGRVHTSNGTRSRTEVRLDGPGRHGAIEVAAPFCRLLDVFWGALDGTRNARRLVEHVKQSTGVMLDEQDLVLALKGMRNLRLVTMTA